MTLKKSNNPTLYLIGTQPAHSESDKACDGTFFNPKLIPDVPTRLYTEDPETTVYSHLEYLCFQVILLVDYQFRLFNQFVDKSSVLALNLLLILLFGKNSVVFSRTKSDCCVIVVNQGQSTVRSLNAGTLVTNWTTALSIPHLRSPKVQLASLLFFLCTLTIATRCYASTNSPNQQIDQAQSPSTFSPIRNSKIHSSNLVLSRLINTHFEQQRRSPLAGTFKGRRTKRELGRTKSNLIPEDPIRETKGRLESIEEVRVHHLVGGSNYQNPGLLNGQGADIQIGENLSDVVSVTGNLSRVISDKLNYSIPDVGRPDKQLFQEQDRRLMPPAVGPENNSSLDKWGVVVSIIVSSVALTVTFGLITCILSHYRAGAAAEDGGTASDPNNAALTPTSAPMLSVVSAGATAGVGGMERLRGGRTAARDLATAREQQVRLHALRTDLAVNLPPSITMPDGEDHPYSNARLHIRDPEQEAEIYQKCIRPPPNRTVLESESPPPYRSSSAGLLGSSSSSTSSADWTLGGMSNAPLVERCHSMSSTTRRSDATSNQKTDLLQRTVKIFTGKKTASQAPSPAPTLPVVVVPSRRRPPDQNAHRPSKGGV